MIRHIIWILFLSTKKSTDAHLSDSQDATVLKDPVWVYHPDYISIEYYGDLWHYSLSLEEVPNAGQNIMEICNGISDHAEGWCPQNEEQAKRVYSYLVVRNFMPNSHAAGVLDEAEIANIPSSLMTGYRTKIWDSRPAIPNTIDNVDATVNRGSNGPNDVYSCGPRYGVDAYLQSIKTPTIGFLDNTASAPNHCTALGMHNGYGDDFDNFKLKNVRCDETSYVICSHVWKPPGTSHGGFPIVAELLSSTNIEILRAAFEIMYNPEKKLITRDVDGYLPFPECLEDNKGCKSQQDESVDTYLPFPECVEDAKGCDPGPPMTDPMTDEEKRNAALRQHYLKLYGIVFVVIGCIYKLITSLKPGTSPNQEEERHENQLEDTVQFNNDTEFNYVPVPICFGLWTIYKRVEKASN